MSFEAKAFADAIAFAALHHGGQTDLSGQPYIWHPLRVAEAARAAGEPHSVVLAALFHDLLEDTNVSDVELYDRWGRECLATLQALTRRGPDEDYLTSYLERVRNDPTATRVKLYDLRDNLGRAPLGTPADEERRAKYRKALEILDPQPEPAEPEGWAWPINSRKAHYFVKGRSLCRNWGFFGAVEDLAGSDFKSPDDCAACRRKADKRNAA